MRILHTADWHIGKKLHGTDLQEDITLFFTWLETTIRDRQIDVLLVAGDVFDVANPSAEARSIYYQFLSRLLPLRCQVIVTAGNHDSPGMLNAPAELLKALNITVVGHLPQSDRWAEVLVPLRDEKGHVVAVVAAIPFLRDMDLLQYAATMDHDSREEGVRQGIERVFREVAALAEQQYPGVPLIGMGHLFASGVSTSESEREIQVGNLGAFAATQFAAAYQYLALGHIHRPQAVPQSKAVYAGSPIALSFSEYLDPKRVVVLEWQAGSWQQESIPVPGIRTLVRIRGDRQEVQQQLMNPNWPMGQLPTLVEVEVVEPHPDDLLRAMVEEWVAAFNEQHGGMATVVKLRIHFGQQESGLGALMASETTIEALHPREVFQQKLAQGRYAEEEQALLMDAFEELLAELQQNDPEA